MKNFLTLASVFFVAWFSVRYLLPLLSPFLLGTLLALAAEPMVFFLNHRLRIPRSASTALGVSMAFCFFSMLILLLGAVLLREVRALSGSLPQLEATALSGIQRLQTWAMHMTGYAPPAVRSVLQENMTLLFSDGTAMLNRVTPLALNYAGNLLTHMPDRALTLGTGLISAFLISAKLPKLRRSILHRIPRERLRAMIAAGKRMKAALTGWLTAQLKLMAMTLTILLAGFLLLRIPKAPLWALGVTAVDAFPILGTGTVLLPWSLFSLLQGNGARALGLLGLYATVTLTRSLLEPKLVGRHLGLDPLATLMALYIGYKLWGIGGMIAAPLLAVTALQLVPGRN